ncbi:diaminopimelate epimerase [Paenibacillus sp. CAA11]|uniref:diaminopimelate epimerase n=1 Tax=Paenibacillus sp. CAA11 TaxID=1532905 RepID=UPI000D3669D9|nr:diaminopimelate epimerase [Paenibacillus sp. CAA11]AWB45171.1 diaminopimelate epimerase [Paenibacillus sp. CAA11]
MEFTKMHGMGNDFLVFFGQQQVPENVSELAIKWCNRHFGAGGDGLVFILPSERADFRMVIINSDGTEAEQCGNAIRCAAKYVYDFGHTNKEEITIETLGAGVQPVSLTVEGGKVKSVRVDMGEPVLEGRSIPTTLEGDSIINKPIEAGGREFHFTAVSMGNPHAVIYVDDAPHFDLAYWGPLLETHAYFPRKVNVEFATVTGKDRIEMRVWERGAGPTLACGTGACATLVSSVLNGLTGRSAWIGLQGGDLYIEWKEEDNRVYMTGPADIVYQGSLQV